MWLPDQGGPQGSGTCKEETEFFPRVLGSHGRLWSWEGQDILDTL